MILKTVTIRLMTAASRTPAGDQGSGRARRRPCDSATARTVSPSPKPSKNAPSGGADEHPVEGVAGHRAGPEPDRGVEAGVVAEAGLGVDEHAGVELGLADRQVLEDEGEHQHAGARDRPGDQRAEDPGRDAEPRGQREDPRADHAADDHGGQRRHAHLRDGAPRGCLGLRAHADPRSRSGSGRSWPRGATLSVGLLHTGVHTCPRRGLASASRESGKSGRRRPAEPSPAQRSEMPTRPRAMRETSCAPGGAEGTRTPDPLHAMQMRYQLRHSPRPLPIRQRTEILTGRLVGDEIGSQVPRDQPPPDLRARPGPAPPPRSCRAPAASRPAPAASPAGPARETLSAAPWVTTTAVSPGARPASTSSYAGQRPREHLGRLLRTRQLGAAVLEPGGVLLGVLLGELGHRQPGPLPHVVLPQPGVEPGGQPGLLLDVRRGLPGPGQVGGPQHGRPHRRDPRRRRRTPARARSRRARRRRGPGPGRWRSRRSGRAAAAPAAAARAQRSPDTTSAGSAMVGQSRHSRSSA